MRSARSFRPKLCSPCEIISPSRVIFLLPRMGDISLRPPAAQRASLAESRISIFVVPGLPEIRRGHNLGKIIVLAARRAKITLEDGDILVVAQKIISKAEGRTQSLSRIHPSARAIALAKELSNDPRFIEIVLRESRRIVRSERVLIVETHHGFVCANAGVDHSNVARRDSVTLLP